MFTVLDPLLEFTYHLLLSWRKFALCIQSLLCMLFLFGWPPYQRSDMILMEVAQHAYDMIHYISGLFGYFYVCEIYVNLIWYLYLFMLNKFCLSLSLNKLNDCEAMIYRTLGWESTWNIDHYAGKAQVKVGIHQTLKEKSTEVHTCTSLAWTHFAPRPSINTLIAGSDLVTIAIRN